jgi:hypothetical protein
MYATWRGMSKSAMSHITARAVEVDTMNDAPEKKNIEILSYVKT